MLPSATSLEGKRVPNVTLKTRTSHQWKDVTTDDLFKGRTVVVFSLPGAYTPTCSSTHPAALQRARRCVQGQRRG
jgi:peroxiredoxin